ncbi:MAG: hypothetical protein ACTSSH_03180 [Candidatus Heimdallarchaeota archaeon]
MKFHDEFEERGYKVQAFIHVDTSNREWIVKAFKDGVLVQEIKIPMIIEPRFGIDYNDLRALEEATAKLMQSLP